MNVHALTFCLNKDSRIFLIGRDSGQLTLQSAMEYRLAPEFSHCYSQQLVKGSQNISSVPTEGVVPPSEADSSAMEEQESRRLMTGIHALWLHQRALRIACQKFWVCLCAAGRCGSISAQSIENRCELSESNHASGDWLVQI